MIDRETPVTRRVLTRREETIRPVSLFVIGWASVGGAKAGEQVCLCFEAEQAQTIERYFQRVNEPFQDSKGRTSSKGYLYIPAEVNPKDKEGKLLPDPPGRAVFEIKVPAAGQYNLWIRRWWQGPYGSVFVMMEGSSTKHVFGEDVTYQCWYWGKLKDKLTLKAGVNKLILLNREDGIRLDQILLTTDDRKIPVKPEKPTPGALVAQK